jgi:TonB family protein
MKYLFALLLLFPVSFCSAQQRKLTFRTINGTVADQDNNPATNCTVMFSGISMGSSTDKEGKFKLHFPDEPIMITVFDRTNNRQYFLIVNLDQQTLNIKLDKATAALSKKNEEDFNKNKEAYTNRISQAIQSEEFFEYVHNGQKRTISYLTVDMPVNNNPQQIDSNKIYTSVERNPEFEGGFAGWSKYVKDNLQYPDKAKQANLQGRVIVSFIIERDGSTTDVRVVRSLSFECDAEAVRLIRTSPKWKSAIVQGRNVRCLYTLPVTFGD